VEIAELSIGQIQARFGDIVSRLLDLLNVAQVSPRPLVPEEELTPGLLETPAPGPATEGGNTHQG
jgi:hypothetical protein